MENKIPLDALDRKILAELDRNARIGISELSRRMRHGRDIIDYRLQRLFDSGTILQSSAVTNPYALGFTLFKSYLKLRNESRRISSLRKGILNHQKVFCIAACDGEWDLIFTIIARSAHEASQVLDEILFTYADIIIAHDFAVVLRYHLCSRNYLHENSPNQEFIIGGEPNDFRADDLELQLLDLLSRDARASVTEMATALKISPIMVKTRIERLEQHGVIVGYRLGLDRKKLNLSSFKAQIDLPLYDKKEVSRLIEYCVSSPWIVKVIVQLGRCPLECNIDAQGYDHFHKIISELKSAFPQLIRTVSTVIVNTEHFRWLAGSEAFELQDVA